MNGDRRCQDIFERRPDVSDQCAARIDAGRTHHETSPTVGQLHDTGAYDIQENADQDVYTLRIANDVQTDTGRQEIQQRHERPRIAAHLGAERTEEERQTKDNDRNAQALTGEAYSVCEGLSTLQPVPAVVVKIKQEGFGKEQQGIHEHDVFEQTRHVAHERRIECEQCKGE